MIKYAAYVEASTGLHHYLDIDDSPNCQATGYPFWSSFPKNIEDARLFNSVDEIKRMIRYAIPYVKPLNGTEQIHIISVEFKETTVETLPYINSNPDYYYEGVVNYEN